MTLKNYEHMFSLVDFSVVPEYMLGQTLPLFLAVCFQQIAKNEHDYVHTPLFTIEREMTYIEDSCVDSYYPNSYFESTPLLKPSTYFIERIKHNKSLSLTQDMIKGITLRQDYNLDMELGDINNLDTAQDFIIQATEDDSFNDEVDIFYNLAKTYHQILVEKTHINLSLTPIDTVDTVKNKVKI